MAESGNSSINIVVKAENQTNAAFIAAQTGARRTYEEIFKASSLLKARQDADDVLFKKHLADERAEYQKHLDALRAFDAKRAAQAKADAAKTEGKGGIFGKIGEGMQGFQSAAAAAGITFAGVQLNNFTRAAVKARNELDAGTISAGQMVENLAGAIPIYGQIWQAGRNIRELMTGELAAVEKIKQEHEQIGKVLEGRLALQKAQNDADEEHLLTLEKIRNEQKLMLLPPEQQDAERRRQSAVVDQRSVATGLEETEAKINAGAQANRKPIEEAIEANAARENELRDRPFWAAQEGDFDRLQEAVREDVRLKKRRDAADAQRDAALKDARANAAETARELASTAAIEEAAAEQKRLDDLAKMREEFLGNVAGMEARARDERLRAMGLDYDAQVEQAQAAYEQTVAAIEAEAAKLREKAGASGDVAGIDADLDRGLAAADAQHQTDITKAQDDERKRQEADAKRAAADRTAAIREQARQTQETADDEMRLLEEQWGEQDKLARRVNFSGTAQLVGAGGTGLAASAREAAMLKGGSDTETQQREKDRAEARKRHDENKRMLERQTRAIVDAITNGKEVPDRL